MPLPDARRTYGTVSAEQRRDMSGLQFVQGLADGTLPLNTIAGTLGYDVSEATNGRVEVTIEPNDTHLNPPARCTAARRPPCSTAAWAWPCSRRWRKASP